MSELLLLTIQRCTPLNSSLMTCVMPEVLLPSDFQVDDDVDDTSVAAAGGSVVSRRSSLDDRDRADLYIGLQFDGYRDYANLTAAIPGITLEFYQPPTFHASTDVIAYRPESLSDIDIKVRLLRFDC